jgi:hypothetical protein
VRLAGGIAGAAFLSFLSFPYFPYFPADNAKPVAEGTIDNNCTVSWKVHTGHVVVVCVLFMSCWFFGWTKTRVTHLDAT